MRPAARSSATRSMRNAALQSEAFRLSAAYGRRVPRLMAADGQPRKINPDGDPFGEPAAGQHQREHRQLKTSMMSALVRHHDGHTGQPELSLRADSIEQLRQAGRLPLVQQSQRRPRHRQHEADVPLGFPIFCSAEHRDVVGAEARQRSGEKQVDRIEAAQAALSACDSFECVRYSSSNDVFFC